MEAAAVVLQHLVWLAAPEVIDTLVLRKSCTADSAAVAPPTFTWKTLTHSLIRQVMKFKCLQIKRLRQLNPYAFILFINFMQSEQAIIDTFISYIKNISLHIEYLFHPNLKQFRKIKENSIKLVTQFDKFVAQYNHRVVQQIKNTKISLSPMFFRSIKDKIYNQDFMRFEAKSYGMKFVFLMPGYQCNMHIQLYKKAGCGLRTTSLTLRKLQNCFIHKISKKIDDNMNLKWLQDQAIKFLQEVYNLLNGESLCFKCNKCMNFNNDLKLILAPTIRLQMKKQDVTIVKYAHQGCL